MSTNTEKTYRLVGDAFTLSYMLKTGRNKKLTIFDDSHKDSKNHRNRAIRYCSNESSIFLDEQSEHAVAPAILFENKIKETKATDVTLQKFLDIHPDNVANGGYLFELLDFAEEASKELEYEEAIIDIKSAVRKKEKEKNGIEELSTLVAVLTGSVATARAMSAAELKREIYSRVDADPKRFVNDSGEVTIFDDSGIQRKYIVLTAVQAGIIRISLDNREIQWDDKSTIVAVPTGRKPVDFFADYLETNDGILCLTEIQNRF